MNKYNLDSDVFHLDYEDQFILNNPYYQNNKKKFTETEAMKTKKKRENFALYSKFLEENKDKYSQRHYNAIKYCIDNRLNCVNQLFNANLQIEEVIFIYKRYTSHNSGKNIRKKLMMEVIKERKYTEKELQEIAKYKVNFGDYRKDYWFDIQWVYRAIFDYVTGRKDNYKIPCKKNTIIPKVENVLIEQNNNVFNVYYKNKH